MNPNNTYTSLNTAYEFFNTELFNSELPACLITMQRKSKSLGYFSPDRFENKTGEGKLTHEIALNPATFKNRSDTEILSTLLHEMTHLWQEEQGDPGKPGYHNREWADKMESLGLIPSRTGQPDGKKTGQSMTHYIQDGGKFASLMTTFLEKNKTIIYQDKLIAGTKLKVKKEKNKIKYSCVMCGLNVWGKPSISIICGEDNAIMTAI